MNWNEIDTYVKHWLEEAGNRITASFQNELDIETKSDRNDLVTNIDKETEQYFIGNIQSKFPGHHILGEEGYGETLESMEGIVWIIDPIDGTVNFVHQKRNFVISIGIYENGIGRLGYIYDVVQKELYSVEAGKGAFYNGTRLSPLKEPPLRDAIIGINATWLLSNKLLPVENLHDLVRDVRATRSYGSAALECIYVATGRTDAYLTMRLCPWDFAAGKIFIEELGGVVTDVWGNSLNMLEKSSVFACKPGLHKEILENYLLKSTSK
jgi:myo-inositol-1(or 4)-monophosphatase